MSRVVHPIQPLSNLIEIILEQRRIHVESHRGRRVPKHPLHREHRRSGRERHRRCRVPQPVRRQLGTTYRLRTLSEPPPPLIPIQQRPTPRRREHQHVHIFYTHVCHPHLDKTIV